MKSNDEFYKSSRWRKKREKILRRDKYLCRISQRYGKLVQANTVHHIFPRDEYPEYQWEDWNLISVSDVIHNALHDRNSQKLSEKGAELLIKTARKRGITIDFSESNDPAPKNKNFFI